MQRPYMHDAPDYSTRPELAVAALIRMLIRFPVVGHAAMTESIERHLDIIAADARLPAAIRDAALLAAQDWHAMTVDDTLLS
jgi:hypothetical protein